MNHEELVVTNKLTKIIESVAEKKTEEMPKLIRMPGFMMAEPGEPRTPLFESPVLENLCELDAQQTES